MSIWNHLDETELQGLRETQQKVDEAEWELNRTEVALQQQETKLLKVEKEHKYYAGAILQSAVGDDVVPEKPGEFVEDVQFVVEGLLNRKRDLIGKIAQYKRAIDTDAKKLLTKCIERASVNYVDAAEELAAYWQELNMAQLALGDRDLGWMHIAIPGLPCMPTAEERYHRRTLFIGRDEPSADDGRLFAQLERLLT